MKKFLLSFGKILEYEVVKETAKQLVYLSNNGQEIRSTKASVYWLWFNTKKEAVAELLKQTDHKIKQAEDQLRFATNAKEHILKEFKDFL